MHTTLHSRTNRSDGQDTSPPRALGIRWVFPDVSGPFTPLPPGRMQLGRDPECGAHLPGNEVSWHHAETTRTADDIALHDLGSTNGTFINGEPRREANLARGDVIRLGEYIGIVTTGLIWNAAGEAQFGRLPPDLLFGPVLRDAVNAAMKAAPS